MVMEYFNPSDPLIPKAHYGTSTSRVCPFETILSSSVSRKIPRHDEKGLHMMQVFRDRVIFAKVAESLDGGEWQLCFKIG